jgi:hypothetical protein
LQTHPALKGSSRRGWAVRLGLNLDFTALAGNPHFQDDPPASVHAVKEVAGEAIEGFLMSRKKKDKS